MFKILDLILEIFGWIRIVLSPLLLGVVAGGVLYLSYPGTVSFYTGVFLTLLGLFIGILWANKVWRTRGTISFLLRIDATPDLDENHPPGDERNRSGH